MIYLKTYEEVNEKKWYWLLAVGGLILGNMMFSRVDKKPETEAELNINDTLDNATSMANEDWVIKAKEEVINKIQNGDLPNKDTIIYHIKNCKIIENPKYFKINTILSTAYAGYLYYGGDDYILINKDTVNFVTTKYTEMLSKVDIIKHEFFHLVDYHRLLENGPHIDIDKTIKKDEYCEIFGKILNIRPSKIDSVFTETLKNFNTKKEYWTNETEIYTRVNMFKEFLYENNYIKSQNEDISKPLWDSIFNGDFSKKYKQYKDDEKVNKEGATFLNSDFIMILPFIRKAKLQELNKLAYIPENEKTKNLV